MLVFFNNTRILFHLIAIISALSATAQTNNNSTRTHSEVDSISSNIQLLNGMTIIGQRYALNTFEQPEATVLMDEKTLKQRSPMAMQEVVSHIPGIWMQKTNHGGGSPFIRGLTGYQVLLMVDGIRFNNSTFRSGPNQYLNTLDPFNLSRIEAIRGAGSVQYGSDAIGGTLLFLTKNPEFSEKGLTISGDVYGKVVSSNMEKSTRLELNIASKNVSLIGGVSYQNLGNIKAGGNIGVLSPTGYDALSYDFKSRIHLNNNQEFVMAYQNLKQTDVPLYHKIATGDYSTYNFNPQQRNLAYIRLKSQYQSKFFSKVRYTLSHQSSLEKRHKQKSGSQSTTLEQDELKTLGATIEVISYLNDHWNVTTGIEYYNDNISSFSNVTNQGIKESYRSRGLYADGSSYQNSALFTLLNYSIERWNISFGARYNIFNLTVPDSLFGETKINLDALVGNASLIYKINTNNNLIFSSNTAFRAPNINDVSSFGVADFRYEIPNQNLKPEKSATMEVGFKTKHDNFSMAIYEYRNGLTDLITNVPATLNGLDSIDSYRIYKKNNVNEAVIWGTEIELEYAFNKQLKMFGNIFYTYGQNISKNEPMRRIPPIFGKLGMSYTKDKLYIRLESLFAAAQQRLSGGDIADYRIQDGGTPGWGILNLNTGFSLRLLDLNAGIANIFNQAYRVHGSGVDGLGRNVWLSCRMSF